MSLWAVWEGNAGVGNPKEFSEKGMFVKSDMFPYNTLIEIENLENGKKTTAFVSGNSGVAGLLVSLSPDVANVLGVASNKIVRVRIEMTSTLSDDFVKEENYLSEDADYNPALNTGELANTDDKSLYSDSDTVLFDPASLKKYPKPGTPIQKSVTPEAKVEPKPEVAETKVPAKTQPAVTPDKAYLERAGLKPPKPQAKKHTTSPKTETTTTTTTTTQIITEVSASKPVETPAKVSIPAPKVETPKPVFKPVETLVELNNRKSEYKTPPQPVREIDGIKKPEKKNAFPAKPVAEIGKVVDREKVKKSIPKPVNDVQVLVKPKSEKALPPKAVNDIQTIAVPQKEKAVPPKPVTNVDGVMAPKPQKTESVPVKTIDGIKEPEQESITPVKKVVPIKPVKSVESQNESSESEQLKVKKSEIVEPVQTSKQTTETITTVTVINEPEKTVKQTATTPKVTELKNISDFDEIKIEPYVVQADSQMYSGKLQKGKYYLQIANYSKESNVQSVLAKYSKYPLAIEKLGSGSRTRYRVFVGPLKIDEMGATMEQFYKFGFKDSFFKVIH